MKNLEPVYIAIDLKSFYASVECVERGLNPLTENLVVADESRTDKTICLAVSPALKSFGIPGRPRLFEVKEAIGKLNDARKRKAPHHVLQGKSIHAPELKNNETLEIDYLIAPPQMSKYMEISSKIYDLYLEDIAPEDIHVYSIDEVFINAAPYLQTYDMTAKELTMYLVHKVLNYTGITATAGIGTNLYLCKIAMDIVAKRMPADEDGVRVAELDEMGYRQLLWDHQPLTDFWRIGKGIMRRLEGMGLLTMGDIARASLRNEDRLYREFGIQAELLIDHAWGWEPCRIEDIHSYRPENNSLSNGQVLTRPYTFSEARLIVCEMTEMMALNLVEKRLVTNQVVLTVCYDTENLADPEKRFRYKGEITHDYYGRTVPKEAHGSAGLKRQTSSAMLLTEAVLGLYDVLVNPLLTVRRLNICVNHVVPEGTAKKNTHVEQLDFFSLPDEKEEKKREEMLNKERSRQEAIVSIHRKYGKNAVVKGSSLLEESTLMERNNQVGGHKA